jgi:1-acyl-sn-glycerol-3-phosphate acyltransferase
MGPVFRSLSQEARERVERLELPFGPYGVDPFGVSKRHVAQFFTALGLLYRHYLTVVCEGIEHVPARGRVMLIGNHSGGVALDGAMVLASLFFDREPPRLAQGMAEKFIHRMPVVSSWACRTGQLTGLPEHAERLLAAERALLVFPEGARGTAKLYKQRDSLVEFGTGFMRLAMKMQAPIVPFAFVGGGEAIPTIANLYGLGKRFGVPYLPVTPYLLPLPLPVKVGLVYGPPMHFEGTGNEDDAHVQVMVAGVKDKIRALIHLGREVLA